jgi:phosphoglycolate phosphatase
MGLTIVFDLDGTLVDTAPDLVDTLNAVFASEGLPPVPFAAARNMIGGGARRMIERGLAAEGRSCGADEIERLFGHFIEHYAAHIADRSRPFPALEAALDALAADGARLAVCTNKLERLSVMLLDALGLTPRFQAICGQDTFGMQKPDPEILRRTIWRAGGRAERAVMVGDSKNDIDTARAAGVPVVAVDFGYTEIPVARLAPDRIISHYAELPAAVGALFGRAAARMPGAAVNE